MLGDYAKILERWCIGLRIARAQFDTWAWNLNLNDLLTLRYGWLVREKVRWQARFLFPYNFSISKFWSGVKFYFVDFEILLRGENVPWPKIFPFVNTFFRKTYAPLCFGEKPRRFARMRANKKLYIIYHQPELSRAERRYPSRAEGYPALLHKLWVSLN